MSASVNPIHALVARLNARRNVTHAEVETLLDMLIDQQLSAYVRDLRQSGLSPDEIEQSIAVRSELAQQWESETMAEVNATFFNAKGNAPTMH